MPVADVATGTPYDYCGAWMYENISDFHAAAVSTSPMYISHTAIAHMHRIVVTCRALSPQGPASDDITIPMRDRSYDRYRGAMIAAAILIGVSQTADMGGGRVSSLGPPPRTAPPFAPPSFLPPERSEERLHVAG